MAFSNQLAKAGFPPDSVKTTAKVHIEKGSITKVELMARAKVPGVDENTFREKAEAARTGCPVSKALQAVTITLDARLEA
jgi:osmotically inducible protein OsmC